MPPRILGLSFLEKRMSKLGAYGITIVTTIVTRILTAISAIATVDRRMLSLDADSILRVNLKFWSALKY